MLFSIVFLASLLTALSNLFIRASMDGNKSGQGDPFLLPRLLSATAVIVAVSFFTEGRLIFDQKMALLGLVAGCILGLLMWSIGHSVKNGPPALSFTFSTVAYIVPPLLMAVIFGSDFGHEYGWQHALGSSLVIAGLVWMGREKLKAEGKQEISKSWLFWIAAAFTINVFYLTFFQWRALLVQEGLPTSTLIPFQCDPARTDCFTLAMFLSAAMVQLFIPGTLKFSEHSRKKLLSFGVAGGLINGISGLVFVRATEMASCASEKAIMFPFFCVSLIFLCNLWGYWFYKEKINWIANFVCALGIVLSSLT